jgi:hypothetical protein
LETSILGTKVILQVLALLLVVFVAIEAALARWSTPGSIFVSGLAHVFTWLACSVWGASVIRRAATGRWRPIAGVLAFLLLLAALLVVAVIVGCLVDRGGCFY